MTSGIHAVHQPGLGCRTHFIEECAAGVASDGLQIALADKAGKELRRLFLKLPDSMNAASGTFFSRPAAEEAGAGPDLVGSWNTV